MAEGEIYREDDYLISCFLPYFEHIEEEEVEAADFLPDFKKYRKKKLNFSRINYYGDADSSQCWVFWNKQDDGVYGSKGRFLDRFPDVCASRKVRRKIRHALHELILLPRLSETLVQFWAPSKTAEGQILLKSQNEPFALSDYFNDDKRDNMCKYRMEMCEEYPYFYSDANCSEKQLGLPGRVFLHQLPEFNSKVCHYSEEEYPQLELALRCGIKGTWALPVFEPSSHSCLGVLELVRFLGKMSDFYGEEANIRKSCDIFQEYGLLCFHGSKQFTMELEGKKEAFRDASEELKLLCVSLCKIHYLPLALTWFSCGSCGDVLKSLSDYTHRCRGEEYWDSERYRSFSNIKEFAEASRHCFLKKGQFTGRILPFPNLLYRSDVKQFSIAEYLLVPHARKCELISGCFTMCLQSSYTGDQLYVLELFFPASNGNGENILTTLRLILNTMEEHSKTFKLASGQGFGEELSVEFIDFENGQKSHSVKMIPARSIPLHERLLSLLHQWDEPSVDAVNSRMHVATEPQSSNLPSLDIRQNGNVMTQLDSSRQSIDLSNKGQNFVTAEQNILVVPSSKGSKRKMKDTQHEKAGVRIDVSLEEIHRCSQMRHCDAAKMLKVSQSTLKRVCRDYGILQWPPRNIEHLPVENKGHTPQLNSDLPSNEASSSAADTTMPSQDAGKVTIHAKYGDLKIKFHLSSSSELRDLQNEVAKRLDLTAGTYHIAYKDKEEELTLITFDDDLQDCIQYFRSMETTSIVLHLRGRLP